jgi:chloramphenicol 3-O phosphotransferase
MSAARIVLLNGPGSVGKSSVAAALQAIAARPLLHLSMDRFCEMLPAHLRDHADTFRFDAGTVGGRPVTEVITGATGTILLTAMRRTVAVLADAGFDVVVDDVWLDGEPEDYASLLSGHRVFRVGLTADLATLEAREAARGDRMPGLSRAQIGHVHTGVSYDLVIDMSATAPQEAARRIVELSGL